MERILDKAKELVTEKAGKVPKPEAAVSSVELKELSRKGITILIKISVCNPYAVSIPVCEIACVMKSAGREIVSCSIPDPGSIKAKEETVLNVSVTIPHSAVLSLARDVGSDWDIDYALELGLIMDLPVLGNVTIPVKFSGELKLPTVSDFLRKKDEGK